MARGRVGSPGNGPDPRFTHKSLSTDAWPADEVDEATSSRCITDPTVASDAGTVEDVVGEEVRGERTLFDDEA